MGEQQIPAISPWKSMERGPLPWLPLCFGVLGLCCVVTVKGGERHRVSIVSDLSARTEKANLCPEPDDSCGMQRRNDVDVKNSLFSLKLNELARSSGVTCADRDGVQQLHR